MSDYTGGEGGYTPLMGASNTPYDISNTTRHEVPNYEGTPTQFYDDSGLKAILTRKGIMDVNSFNPIVKEGEKITVDTPRQATNGDGQLLFLDSSGEQTTRPTGVPVVGGTIGDAAYMKAPVHGGGVLGDIGYDLRSTAKDPLFHKFLLTAAAIGTGGLAANAAFGAGAAGAGGALGATPVAEAFPVLGGGALGGTELGAAGLGLTDAEATALMGEYAPGALGGYGTAGATGLTLADALKYAKMGLSGAGILGGLLGGGSGGGSPGAGGGSGGGSGGGAGSTIAYNPNGPWNAPITPGTFTTGLHQQTPVTAGAENLKMLFPELDPALARQFAMSGNTGSNLGGNYFAYGSSPPSSNSPLSEVELFPRAAPLTAKDGGVIQAFKDGGAPHIPEFITGTTGHYVKGRGDGQSDDIPAMLADGEYVFDADTVAQLGNGSSDAGAKVLDKMRESLRHHKRSAPVDSIPPKAKSPLEYIKLGMKRK